MKITRLKIVLLLLGLLLGINISADNAFSRYGQILGNSSNEGKMIEQFAEHAAAKEVDEAMALLTSAIKGREALVVQDFNSRLFPFFEDYVEIHNAKTIGTSVFPDGSRGTTHYIYIITKSGQKKPLMISFRKENGRTVILDIAPNKCVPGRHPSCDDGDFEEEDDY